MLKVKVTQCVYMYMYVMIYTQIIKMWSSYQVVTMTTTLPLSTTSCSYSDWVASPLTQRDHMTLAWSTPLPRNKARLLTYPLHLPTTVQHEAWNSLWGARNRTLPMSWGEELVPLPRPCGHRTWWVRHFLPRGTAESTKFHSHRRYIVYMNVCACN